MKHRALAATGLFAIALFAGGTAAEAAAIPAKSSFTVVTSFVSGSPIIAADGLWTGCATVEDTDGWFNQVKPSKDQFSGEKIVHCSFGDVGIHYDAVTNFRAGQGRTSGTWSVDLVGQRRHPRRWGTVTGMLPRVRRVHRRHLHAVASTDAPPTARAAARTGRPGPG